MRITTINNITVKCERYILEKDKHGGKKVFCKMAGESTKASIKLSKMAAEIYLFSKM